MDESTVKNAKFSSKKMVRFQGQEWAIAEVIEGNLRVIYLLAGLNGARSWAKEEELEEVPE